MDIDSMNRAAFLSAFTDKVKRGDAHAFFVRYDKYLTVDERRAVKKEGDGRRRAFAKTLPPETRKNRDEVLQRMMLAQLRTATPYGKWRDLWVDHPAPTLNEPRKAVCWLTPP